MIYSNKDFPYAFNFAQATGGLGTIEIEGLRDNGDDGGSNGGGGGGGCNAGYGFAGLLLLAGFVTRKYRSIRLHSQK